MEPVYRFGPFRLDPVARRLTREGVSVEVTSRTLDVLLLLVRNAGEVVTREAILDEVWPESVVSDNNVSVQISKLRTALGETARDWRYVETVARRGYRFSHAVRPEYPRSENASKREESDANPEGALSRVDGDQPYPRIAVLPFRIISGDDYFADGFTESPIANLTQVNALSVISRASIMRFRDRRASLPEIARELKVDYVIEGSLFQTSERVRVTAQLIRVPDEESIWAEQYDREIRDLLGLQNELTVEISHKVGARLTAEERSRLSERPVLSGSSVYRRYLRGRYLRNKNTPQDFRRAIEHLEQVVDAEPNFAEPYCLLAQTHFMLGLFGIIPRDTAAGRVRKLVEEALRRGSRRSEPYVSLGLQRQFFDWNWTAAEAAFREAIRLAPGNSAAHQEFGAFLGRTERFEQGRVEIEKALSLDPLSANTQTSIAELSYYEGPYEESAEACRKALELDANYVWALVLLSWSMLQSDAGDRAVDVLRDAVAFSGQSSFALGSLGYAYAVTKSQPAAENVLTELERRVEIDSAASVFAALVELGLSRKKAALAWLHRACELRSPWILLAWTDPRFRTLRGDHRYDDLLARVGYDLKEPT